MANYQVHGVFTFQDINGERANVRIPLGSQADTRTVAGLAHWLAGASGTGSYADLIGDPGAKLTNAKLVRAAAEIVFIEAHISGGTAPADAAYPSVQDKLQLGFRANNGHRTRVSIPAPMDALLLQPPNDYVANPAQTDLAAFLATATAGSGTVGADGTGGVPPLTDGGGTAYGFATGGRKLQRTRNSRGGTDFVTETGTIGVAG